MLLMPFKCYFIPIPLTSNIFFFRFSLYFSPFIIIIITIIYLFIFFFFLFTRPSLSSIPAS